MNKSLRGVISIFILFILTFPIHGQILSGYTSPKELKDFKFSNSVEVRSNGVSKSLTGKDARFQLKKFLSDKSPKEVKLMHEGYSQDKSSLFGILQVISHSEKHRVFYYCELKNGEYYVTKLRLHER